MNDGRRLSVRVGVSVACTWEEFSKLTMGDGYIWTHIKRSAVRVLGHKRGSVVLSELARGRTPRLVPSKDDLTR